MMKKLDFSAAESLVREALETLRASSDIDLNENLASVLPREGDRHHLRLGIVSLVRRKNLRIDLGVIPVRDETRLRDLAEIVAMSALPGETETPVPDEKEPEPPPKKGKRLRAIGESHSEE